MEEKKTYQEDIESIRKLMERSVKFISLSGFSGIMSGIYALAGVAIANYFLNFPLSRYGFIQAAEVDDTILVKLLLVAACVLIASLVTGYSLTARKSRRVGARIWDVTGKRLLINLSIPLMTGGIFILILLMRGHLELVAPASLIFYGLALINASPGLYEEIRYLGYTEIIFGLISAAYPGYGLAFWALGFGVMHILYGAVMYRKYDS